MNYYNDNDPDSVMWLKQLILAGLIPQFFAGIKPIVRVPIVHNSFDPVAYGTSGTEPIPVQATYSLCGFFARRVAQILAYARPLALAPLRMTGKHVAHLGSIGRISTHCNLAEALRAFWLDKLRLVVGVSHGSHERFWRSMLFGIWQNKSIYSPALPLAVSRVRSFGSHVLSCLRMDFSFSIWPCIVLNSISGGCVSQAFPSRILYRMAA